MVVVRSANQRFVRGANNDYEKQPCPARVVSYATGVSSGWVTGHKEWVP